MSTHNQSGLSRHTRGPKVQKRGKKGWKPGQEWVVAHSSSLQDNLIVGLITRYRQSLLVPSRLRGLIPTALFGRRANAHAARAHECRTTAPAMHVPKLGSRVGVDILLSSPLGHVLLSFPRHVFPSPRTQPLRLSLIRASDGRPPDVVHVRRKAWDGRRTSRR